MVKRLIIAYLVVIHIGLMYIAYKFDFVERLLAKFDEVPQVKLDLHYQRMLKSHLSIDALLPDNAIVFIGDSITEGLAVTAVTSNGINFGIGGDTTIGVLNRVRQYTSLNKTQTIVLAIGVNDLKVRENSEIIENFKKIFHELQEKSGARIVISAILPTNEAVRPEWKGFNARINDLNQFLAAFCDSNDQFSFLNIGPLLANIQGNLDSQYHNGDGVHLSTKAYQLWINALKHAIKS